MEKGVPETPHWSVGVGSSVVGFSVVGSTVEGLSEVFGGLKEWSCRFQYIVFK